MTGFALDCYEFLTYTYLCYLNAACSEACSTFLIVVDAAIYAPAHIIPVFLYIMLYKKARKMKRAMAEKSNWTATITFFLIFLISFVLVLLNVLYTLVVQALYSHSETLPVALYIWLVAAARIITFILITDAIFILRNKDVKGVIKEAANKLFKKKMTVPATAKTVMYSQDKQIQPQKLLN